jgi:hypothetical protein
MAETAVNAGTKLLNSNMLAMQGNEPPFMNAVTAVKFSAAAVPVPVGAVFAWQNAMAADAGATLGYGWAPLDGQALDGGSPFAMVPNLNGVGGAERYFLRAAASSGGTGGANAHAHLMGYVDDTAGMGTSWRTAAGALLSSAESHLPPYYDVRWVMRVSALGDASPPIGAIVPWLKSLSGVSPTLPSGYVECNGVTLNSPGSPLHGKVIPNLNGEGRYLRGAPTAGGRDGGLTHSHTIMTSGATTPAGSGGYAFMNPVSAVNHEPQFYTVVWVMRVR